MKFIAKTVRRQAPSRLTETTSSRWELAAESIALKMRWIGLAVGYWLCNAAGREPANPAWLNILLTLGLLYASVDGYFTWQGQLFTLARRPNLIALLESIFIGLLCLFDTGLESPFRYYYLLSLVVSAIRYPLSVPYITCLFHAGSYSLLYLGLPSVQQHAASFVSMLVIMAWVAWAASALALLLKQAGIELHHLNQELQKQQQELEKRIQERTRELQESQARLLHQEKQATFGLLAAGIAHEVGNPLTVISGIVQMLQRQNKDAVTQDKLRLMHTQLDRIQKILRELIDFSRPDNSEKEWLFIDDVIHEAIHLAKYYKRLGGKNIATELTAPTPRVWAARNPIIQAMLNLILNAIDATEQGGQISVQTELKEQLLTIKIMDNGQPLPASVLDHLFQPYQTGKPHGTGLGLYITHRLIHEQGGWVEYQCTNDSSEKAFVLYLPISKEPMSESKPHVAIHQLTQN